MLNRGRSAGERKEAARELLALACESRSQIMLNRGVPSWLASDGRRSTLEAFFLATLIFGHDDELSQLVILDLLSLSAEVRRWRTPLHVADLLAEDYSIAALRRLNRVEEARRRAGALLQQVNSLLGNRVEFELLLETTRQMPSPDVASDWHMGPDSLSFIIAHLAMAFQGTIPPELPDRFVELVKDQRVEWFNIARVYERAGMKSKAFDYYRRVAQESHPSPEERRLSLEALERLKE